MCPARSLEPLLRGEKGNVIVHCGAWRRVVIHYTDLCLFGLSWQDQFITAGHVGLAFSTTTASTATFPRLLRPISSGSLPLSLSCVLYVFYSFILHCLAALDLLDPSFCTCLSPLCCLSALLLFSFVLVLPFVYILLFILYEHISHYSTKAHEYYRPNYILCTNLNSNKINKHWNIHCKNCP